MIDYSYYIYPPLTFTIGWLKPSLFIFSQIVEIAFNFHHRVVETVSLITFAIFVPALTFTIGWLKLVSDDVYSAATESFNFHHRVVETLSGSVCSLSYSTLTFTIGWLKRRELYVYQKQLEALTFTIGWLKLCSLGCSFANLKL